MMNMSEMLKSLMPFEGKIPATDYKVDIKGGWLIIAVKLPQEAKG